MKPAAFSNFKVLLSFKPFFEPHRGRIARWFLVYGAYFLAGILTPYAFSVFIDYVLPGGQGPPPAWPSRLGLPAGGEAKIWAFCAVYLCYAVGLQTLNYFGTLGTSRIIEDVVGELRAVVFEKLHRVQLRFYDRTLSGEIVNQVTTDTRLGGRYRFEHGAGLDLSVGAYAGMGYATMFQNFRVAGIGENTQSDNLYDGEGFMADLDLRLGWAVPGVSWLRISAQGGYRYASLGELSSHGNPMGGPERELYSLLSPGSNIGSAVDVDFSGLTGEGSVSVLF